MENAEFWLEFFDHVVKEILFDKAPTGVEIKDHLSVILPVAMWSASQSIIRHRGLQAMPKRKIREGKV